MRAPPGSVTAWRPPGTFRALLRSGGAVRSVKALRSFTSNLVSQLSNLVMAWREGPGSSVDRRGWADAAPSCAGAGERVILLVGNL